MNSPTFVSSSELRENLSEVLGQVGYGHARVMITRNGTPLAAMVPAEDLELIQRLYDASDARAVQEVIDKLSAEKV